MIPETPSPNVGRRDRPIVQAIVKKMREDSHTYQAIADFLNTSGYVTSQGKPFTVQRIQHVIRTLTQAAANS